jgi:hypothetical protein
MVNAFTQLSPACSYLILRGLSRPRLPAPRLAASRCSGLPRRSGDAAIAASEQRPPEEGGWQRGRGEKWLLKFLSSHV